MKIFEINQDGLETYLKTTERCKYKWENGNDIDNGIEMLYNKRHEKMIKNNIGYVHVYGTLLNDATELDRLTGNTDYDDIVDDLEDLVEEGVLAIVIVFNSGGGMVQGSYECSDYIKNLPVPTIAYVEACACSAAYKLASSCSYIIASETASVGNIGTISVYTDQSKIFSDIGVKMITFVNDGAIYKSIGHGDTSLTEEQVSYLQNQIDKAGKKFQEYVKVNRLELLDEVFTAAVYSDQEAVTSGLIDLIGTAKTAQNIAENITSLQ